MAVEVDPEAIRGGASRMGVLKTDAQTIAEVSEEVSPAPGTWGPFLGMILGGSYHSSRTDLEELLNAIPLAIENHEIRLSIAAQVYEENDEAVDAAFAVIEAEIDRSGGGAVPC